MQLTNNLAIRNNKKNLNFETTELTIHTASFNTQKLCISSTRRISTCLHYYGNKNLSRGSLKQGRFHSWRRIHRSSTRLTNRTYRIRLRSDRINCEPRDQNAELRFTACYRVRKWSELVMRTDKTLSHAVRYIWYRKSLQFSYTPVKIFKIALL
jgi:hypothetical protein